jgi:trans-2,3-dihydro-3-hydroxyanthranilate isomerase
MQLTYHTVDVFTRTRFGGNPLAVVLDADALTTDEMQAVAREFNYSETSFVRRPADQRHTAEVRIFTPTTEVPFAGHPNVGTAFVLASREGTSRSEEFLFEEKAGLVRARVIRDQGRVDQIQLTAPQKLSGGRSFDLKDVAACLSLTAADVATSLHAPRIASVGLPFLVVEIASREALAHARPKAEAFERILPIDGADAIYLYCREPDGRDGDVDFTARMFAPSDGVPEDPATGSATAATCALIASLEGAAQRGFRIAQGMDMGRPSLLMAEVDEDGTVRIGGACVSVMTGTLTV